MSAAKTSVYVADTPPPPMLCALELHAIYQYVLHVLVVVVVEVLHIIVVLKLYSSSSSSSMLIYKFESKWTIIYSS